MARGENDSSTTSAQSMRSQTTSMAPGRDMSRARPDLPAFMLFHRPEFSGSGMSSRKGCSVRATSILFTDSTRTTSAP